MSPESSSSDQHSHTLTEILSQPETWRSCIRRLRGDGTFESAKKKLYGRKSWLFTGCGTSFYLAEAAAACWTLLTGQNARALPSSEILLFPRLAQLSDPELQAVVISRSGSTSEAVRAAEDLRNRHRIATLGITCTKGSELARECDLMIELPGADEKSVVMTRSFSTMLLALLLLAGETGDGRLPAETLEQIAGSLDSRLTRWNQEIKSFVTSHSFEDYIYLAQGPFFPIGREAALKVTEMSHSYAQSYHTLEFRHGPKAIVGPETCIGFLLSETGMAAESEVLQEMKELGGTIVAICNRASDQVRKSSDLLLEFEASVPEVMLLAPFVAPAQLLGYHVGVRKGFNPDTPKNLSRVVILD
ncbi:MAG TPA: SIS domain-containing protein [Candidatus Eisenbacteria bacterium]|nr:SIS domain-containing protein [Candidatus Eisenbacteria bacterium]